MCLVIRSPNWNTSYWKRKTILKLNLKGPYFSSFNCFLPFSCQSKRPTRHSRLKSYKYKRIVEGSISFFRTKPNLKFRTFLSHYILIKTITHYQVVSNILFLQQYMSWLGLGIHNFFSNTETVAIIRLSGYTRRLNFLSRQVVQLMRLVA